MAVYDKASNLVRTVNLNLDESTLLGGNGGIAPVGLLKANQTTPAPLNGDPPNISMRISSQDTPIHRAQGFLTVDGTTDENETTSACGSTACSLPTRFPRARNLRWTVHVAASDAINLPPELGGISSGLVWTEGDAPKPDAPAVTLADHDSANLATGNLTAADWRRCDGPAVHRQRRQRFHLQQPRSLRGTIHRHLRRRSRPQSAGCYVEQLRHAGQGPGRLTPRVIQQCLRQSRHAAADVDSNDYRWRRRHQRHANPTDSTECQE